MEVLFNFPSLLLTPVKDNWTKKNSKLNLSSNVSCLRNYNKDHMQQDGWKTQDCRVTKKINVAQECTFPFFCRSAQNLPAVLQRKVSSKLHEPLYCNGPRPSHCQSLTRVSLMFTKQPGVYLIPTA